MEKEEDRSRLAYSWRRLYLSRAKLKASSNTSALLSGFAMVAMVEAHVSENLPASLLIIFSICTTLLVAVHMLALMISTCILPHIDAVAATQDMADVEESPHERMSLYIAAAWAFSTVFGSLLFLVEIVILCWVKFYEYSIPAAVVSNVLLVPVIFIFVAFAVHFYRKLVGHQYERSEHGLRELETILTQLQTDNQEMNMNSNTPLNMKHTRIHDV